MTQSRLVTSCVWLLGCGVVVTGFMAGLDHWGSYRRYASRGRPRAEMPVDAVAVDPSSSAAAAGTVGYASTSYVSAPFLSVDADDYAGDEPDEPVGDCLCTMLWLCDDDDTGKQWALAISPADAHSVALTNQSDGLPCDNFGSSPLSLSALHIRMQI